LQPSYSCGGYKIFNFEVAAPTRAAAAGRRAVTQRESLGASGRLSSASAQNDDVQPPNQEFSGGHYDDRKKKDEKYLFNRHHCRQR